jgi:ribonucleotide monophosphatase NagD (HAD superfamily)
MSYMESDPRPKTIICDIDGTLIDHQAPGTRNFKEPSLLPGVMKKFQEWDAKGYNIILITGRRESARLETEKQISGFGLFYDQLIMGVGGGERILINDVKPTGQRTAFAINVDRDKGLDGITL